MNTKGKNVKLEGINEEVNHNFMFHLVIINNVIAYIAHMEACVKRIK